MRPASAELGNSSISRRIYVGFAFVLVLLAAEVGVALRGFARIRTLRQEISEAIDPPSVAAGDLERTVLYRALAVHSFASTRDARFRADASRFSGRAQALMERLRRFELEPESRARLPHEMVGLVAVTGYGQEDDRRRAAEAGIDRHLVKPVELDELKEVIERLAFQEPPERGGAEKPLRRADGSSGSAA